MKLVPPSFSTYGVERQTHVPHKRVLMSILIQQSLVSSSSKMRQYEKDEEAIEAQSIQALTKLLPRSKSKFWQISTTLFTGKSYCLMTLSLHSEQEVMRSHILRLS